MRRAAARILHSPAGDRGGAGSQTVREIRGRPPDYAGRQPTSVLVCWPSAGWKPATGFAGAPPAAVVSRARRRGAGS